MKTSFVKKISLAFLSLALVVSAAVTGNFTYKKASAIETPSFNVLGASVRYVDATSGYNAIKFGAKFPKSLAETNAYGFHCLVVPTDTLGGGVLDVTNKPAVDVKINSYKVVGEEIELAAAIYNIPENQYTRSLTYRFYAVNGTTYYYSDANVTSMDTVLSAVIASTGDLELKQNLTDLQNHYASFVSSFYPTDSVFACEDTYGITPSNGQLLLAGSPLKNYVTELKFNSKAALGVVSTFIIDLPAISEDGIYSIRVKAIGDDDCSAKFEVIDTVVTENNTNTLVTDSANWVDVSFNVKTSSTMKLKATLNKNNDDSIGFYIDYIKFVA